MSLARGEKSVAERVAMNDVTADLMLQIIGPTMLGLIVFVCFGAWLLLGRRHYLLIFAGAPLLGACAAFLQIFPLLPILGLNVVLSNALLTSAFLAAAEGVLARSGKRIGLAWDVAIVVCLFGLVVYFYFVAPNFHARVYLQDFSAGGILLVTAARVRHLTRGHVGDRILFWTMLVYGTGLFPLAVLSSLHSSQLTKSAFSDPVYWQSLQLTNTVLGAAFIVSFIVAALIDFIGDLQRERDTDRLTGVFNRRGFEERAEMLLGKSGAAVHTLIVCDLDHFKRVNDTYGHSTGDSVLRVFGQVLKRITGEAALIGRIGGEEFAVLLSDNGVAEARAFVERLQDALAGADYGLPPGAGAIEISLGVAGWVEGEGYSAMFDRADAALYRAKSEGRNQAVYVGEVPSPGRADGHGPAVAPTAVRTAPPSASRRSRPW
jgi:diguanylate cyclase (GGDEF)-like protein